MIIRGSEKGRFEFYLVLKPIINLFIKKEPIKILKNLFIAIKDHIYFSPLSSKEKSLYNLGFLDNTRRGGGI